jgi:hypothetical protein
MSRDAWLVCEESKQMMNLGKIIRLPDTGSVYFHDWRSSGDKSNSENKVLVKAIMRFLAENMGKSIRVLPDEDVDELIEDEPFAIIGHDKVSGPLITDYIAEFPG